MSQSHHHQQGGAGSHYYTATSPTSPPPAHYAFDSIYHSNSGGGYPSSTSSNDPAMTQEEADLKRLRNTAVSSFLSWSKPDHSVPFKNTRNPHSLTLDRLPLSPDQTARLLFKKAQNL